MSDSTIAELHLNDLPKIVQGLSTGKALFQIECCVWCMFETNQDNGSNLRVIQNRKSDYYTVTWNDSPIDNHNISNSIHVDEAVEYGAEAIALILAILHTDYDAVRRSRKGMGDDYRLVKSNSKLFQQSAKLEISGILKENPRNSLNKRVKVKLQQVSKYDDGSPGCAIVVEFSNFTAKVAWNNE